MVEIIPFFKSASAKIEKNPASVPKIFQFVEDRLDFLMGASPAKFTFIGSKFQLLLNGKPFNSIKSNFVRSHHFPQRYASRKEISVIISSSPFFPGEEHKRVTSKKSFAWGRFFFNGDCFAFVFLEHVLLPS
jgi:hypothetical protein